ncbi:MAG: hypothetical protein A3D65_00165 [Candidatus Lloydbacteria bacterium RIFCSPHIGHO2_02_FULL_50_13]|uniref:Pyridoxamine 5'-phosphate oxidase N-terminal domain-containing protein n=1 Tax=Candidatus Lloydbacteria bacterium RIFCSPHIGHO2_02_FULL_50_13 TaxID=1798661 RepID=A0A1G2DBF7_9BACT|nr:MAG: hypothetical protein A3D65_00165 [Candidatus Lloydbacteria bacterium RIFCSPHIGHO2_02_FULL_50_13]
MAKILPEERALKFIATRKTLFMATRNTKGVLWASYSPFVYHDGHFYVGINYIAQHTRDLLESNELCVFFREDEENAKNIYALERFAVNCLARVVHEASAEWHEVIRLFEGKFGAQFELARQLRDFYLFSLEPTDQGRYVRGFAQAFDVAADFGSSVHVQGNHQERGGVSEPEDGKKR